MVENGKKLWAHYEQLSSIIGIFISLFFLLPMCVICFSILFSGALEAGYNGAVESAIIEGIKWSAVINSIITALTVVRIIWYSDRVELNDNSIKYYRTIFSKEPKRIISFNEITECVINGGLWNSKRIRTRKRNIIVFNKSNIIITFDIYYKLALILALKLGMIKFRVVGETGNLNTLNKYFKVDFMSLKEEEQLKLLKYYCKITRTKHKTAEELLYKK